MYIIRQKRNEFTFLWIIYAQNTDWNKLVYMKHVQLFHDIH